MREYMDIVNGKTRLVESKEDTLLAIASKYLGVKTFTMAGSDSKDFHDVSVAAVKDALEAAYALGKSESDLDEGFKSAAKGLAMGAAALVSANASAHGAVDPEIVAASGDTAHTHHVVPKGVRAVQNDHKAPKLKVDPKALNTPKGDKLAQARIDPKVAAKRFHLDI